MSLLSLTFVNYTHINLVNQSKPFDSKGNVKRTLLWRRCRD